MRQKPQQGLNKIWTGIEWCLNPCPGCPGHFYKRNLSKKMPGFVIGFALALCLDYRLKKSHNSREKTEDPGSFGLTRKNQLIQTEIKEH